MKKLFEYIVVCMCLLSFRYGHASESLQQFSRWFSPGNLRYQTFEKTFDLMQERNAKVIVETGTTRGVSLESIFGGDGGSTLLFCDWAMRHNARVFSVDISAVAFQGAEPFVKPYANWFLPTCGDSVEFLEKFEGTIDVLYLDSFDFDELNPLPSQEHHLKEIIAAYPKLTPNSIVLLDDCGLPEGGKGKLVIAYLEERGWKVVLNNYQVLLAYYGN